MGKRSSIDKLPKEVRDRIGALRESGCTIDDILKKLAELDVDVSRSAVGRHVKKIDDIGKKLRETRQIADALVSQFGDRPENKMMQLNIELMMPAIMSLLVRDDGEDVVLDAEGAMFLATALQRLSNAQATDTARQLKERAEFARAAAKGVDQVAKSRGLSKDLVNDIKAAILGVDVSKPQTASPARP